MGTHRVERITYRIQLSTRDARRRSYIPHQPVGSYVRSQLPAFALRVAHKL